MLPPRGERVENEYMYLNKKRNYWITCLYDTNLPIEQIIKGLHHILFPLGQNVQIEVFTCFVSDWTVFPIISVILYPT